jgi:hypothetical protein
MNTNYYAAKGETRIRSVHGCSPNNGLDSWVAVIPANMQGPFDFMQIGYGTTRSDGTGLGFWATDHAGNDQIMSPMTLGFGPTVGNLTRFEIWSFVSGPTRYWRMRVTDVTRGAAQFVGWRDREATNLYTGEVWYGIEQHDLHSQFGGATSANVAQLRQLSYKLSANALWTVLEGTGGAAWAHNPGSVLGCWNYSIATYAGPIASDQTSLNGYTANTC